MRANSELADWAAGKVRGHFVNLATGETRGDIRISNIITYGGADIMARLLGGDTQYRPAYMGFIYGAAATPAFDDPPVSRNQSWSGLGTELAADGNILISPLAAGPAYTLDGSSSNYVANAVTLTAHTGTRLELGFTAPGYTGMLTTGDYFWNAMLITRIVRGTSIEYIPFARVSLSQGGTYPQKPDGFELALFWQVSYF